MLRIQIIMGLVLLGVALVGGGLASWSNIRQTRGPRERSFVIRVCLLSWLLILSMLGLMYLLPAPYRYVAMLVYFVGLPILIYRWAKTHQLIRQLDAREGAEAKPSPPVA